MSPDPLSPAPPDAPPATGTARPSQALSDYRRIAMAIELIRQEQPNQPSLAYLAARMDLSPYHLQKLFRRWAGLSPKRFLQYLTVEHAKTLLLDRHSLLEVSLAGGLSGPSRLHDHFVTLEAVTPGEFKARGRGLTLVWGLRESPFGYVFAALSERGITALEFLDHPDPAPALKRLQRHWPLARLQEAPQPVAAVVDGLFEPNLGRQAPLSLWVRGSNFQIQVWKALLRIPPGRAGGYGRIAETLDRPGAARAVGQAVGANPVAFLIPCHRVIQETGILGGYRWNPLRKQALLLWESARNDAATGC